MPRSGHWAQQCKCRKDRRAIASLSLSSSTLGIVPRRKSRTITLYVCTECGKNPRRKTRQALIAAVIAAVKALTPAKPAKAKAAPAKRKPAK